MPKNPALIEMSDDELLERMGSLAEQKRAIKAQENEARHLWEVRQALSGVSDDARRIVSIHLGGAVGPSGSTGQKVQ